MPNTTDESPVEQERSPGFSRSILGRIIAVTLFVGLGTFAVAQSVIGFKATENKEVAAQEGEDVEEKASIPSDSMEQPSAPPPVSKSFAEKSEPPKANTFAPPPISKSFVGSKTSLGDNTPSSVRANHLAPKPADTNPASNGFQAQPAKPVESSIATQLPPLSPFGGNGSSNVNSLKPPTRQNSFEDPTTANLPSAGAISPPTIREIDSQRQNAESALGSIKQNAGDAANDLAVQTENSLRNLDENNSSATRSTFPSSPADTRFASENKNPPQNSTPRNLATGNNSSFSPSPSASFDTSRELKPISQQSPPVEPQDRVELRNSNLPAASPSVQSFPPALSTRPPTNSPSNERPTQSSRTATGSSFPPAMAANRNPTTQVAASTTMLTKSTPGDRQLEGMQSPSVTIEKIAPREIQVNQPADFQLIVKNVGRSTASDVRVFDEIPVGTELIQATPQPNQVSGDKVDWSLGTLNPGQEKRIQLQLKPTQPGEIGSVAHVTFSAQASMRTRVTKPVLSVQHKSEPKVLIGDTVVLDIVVKNEGDGPAANVMIQEDLPEQLEFTDGFRELEYTVGTLAPGQSKDVRLALKAAKIGAFRNVLVAQADGGLQTQHAIDLEVIAPKLVVSSDGPNRRFLKRQTQHQFSVKNVGTAKATNVELVCRLPGGLQYVSTNNRGKYDTTSHAVYWSLAELNPEMTASVELETLPIEPGNQSLTFEAVADLDQKTKLDRDLIVEHLVDVYFEIDDLVDPIEVGSGTAYRVRVVNQGTKTATNVQLQVEFPNGILPTTVDGNVSSEIRGQQVVFAPITSLNPGDEIVLTIRGKGVSPGDHRVIVNLNTDGRETNVSKQETTRVYSDR